MIKFTARLKKDTNSIFFDSLTAAVVEQDDNVLLLNNKSL